jgi:hypothetical protein
MQIPWEIEEGAVTADPTDLDSFPHYHRPTLEEILRDENVKPVENIHDLAVDGFFESDEELEEFLHLYHEQRQSELG